MDTRQCRFGRTGVTAAPRSRASPPDQSGGAGIDFRGVSQWIEMNCLGGRPDGGRSSTQQSLWWPSFVREMIAQIGAALDGKPLDPTIVMTSKRHGPDHRIEIAYVSPEEFAAQRMEEPEGKYPVVNRQRAFQRTD
jgi:hypothetical protein